MTKEQTIQYALGQGFKQISNEYHHPNGHWFWFAESSPELIFAVSYGIADPLNFLTEGPELHAFLNQNQTHETPT